MCPNLKYKSLNKLRHTCQNTKVIIEEEKYLENLIKFKFINNINQNNDL